MSGLFSRKSKSLPEPPLPDELPLSDNSKPKSSPNMNSMPPPPMPDVDGQMGSVSTHDMIPNDIQIGTGNSGMMPPPPMPDDFSPGNLPNIDDNNQFPQAPSDGLFAQNIPMNVESRQLPKLPELPEVRDANITRKQPPAMQAPMPIIGDEEIPSPPAIFSDEHFYDTPQEIRHLIREEKTETVSTIPDYASKYNLGDAQETSFEPEDDEEPVEREILQVRTKGPLFVDIESFRVMLSDIDHIKNNIKTSTQIMEHMTEIKNSKDREFERWRSLLEDMQRKINYVDKLLLKGA